LKRVIRIGPIPQYRLADVEDQRPMPANDRLKRRLVVFDNEAAQQFRVADRPRRNRAKDSRQRCRVRTGHFRPLHHLVPDRARRG
jgi:hypothetical protein